MTNVEFAFEVIYITLSLVGMAFVVSIYNLYNIQKFYDYLRLRKPKRWKEILGGYNTFADARANPIRAYYTTGRVLSYVNNNLDVDDKKIRKFKYKLRVGRKILLILTAFIFIVFFLGMIVAYGVEI